MKEPVKSSYKITNWRKYNESLVKRGSITFWFDEETLAHWEHDNAAVKVGRPFTFSDRAIEVLLALRELFQLPYRQTEGLGRSLLQLMQVPVLVPDFTSLAKRAAKLNIDLIVTRRSGSLHIVVDSTGLKVFGDGEWKVRKHGAGKHRTWRKLHLAINPQTQEIEAETLTENSSIDSSQAPRCSRRSLARSSRFAATVRTTSGSSTTRSPSAASRRSSRRRRTRRSNGMATRRGRRCRGMQPFAPFAKWAVPRGSVKLAIINAPWQKPRCIE